MSDVDPARRAERERQLAVRMAEKELERIDKEKGGKKAPVFDAAAEFAKLTSTRSGGVYMPPARLRAMQAEAAKDKASAEYQRVTWDALRKSITGIVNRVNVGNIKHVVPELFQENLIRGRGLFARSVMKAQAASLPFTPVFAALVAILNTKLPQVGDLVLTRLISQFRRAFKRNDKVCGITNGIYMRVTDDWGRRSSAIPPPPSSPTSSTKLLRMKLFPSRSSSFSLSDLPTTRSRLPSGLCGNSAHSSRRTHQRRTPPCTSAFVLS